MSATIQVSFEGLVICYRKRIDGKDVWRILFPFDEDCHTVKLRSVRGNIKTFHEHLGKRHGRFEIITEHAESLTSSTTGFNRRVFNLTSADTHPRLRRKEGWNERGVLLTVEKMILDDGEPLLVEPEGEEELELILTDERGDKVKTLGTLARTVEGTIHLGDQGRVMVMEGARTIFASQPNESCTLIFDNDCQQRPGVGDMEMFYHLVEEPDNTDHMFLVESRSVGGDAKELKIDGEAEKLTTYEAEIRTNRVFSTGDEPLRFSGDKPCLASQVTEADDLE